MILSKYLHIVENGRSCLIFNFVNGKIIKMVRETYDLIINNDWEYLDTKLINYLTKNLFLVDEDMFSINDYNNRIAININITNKCNFRCNYCYFSKLNNLNETNFYFDLNDFKFWYKSIIDSNSVFKYVDVIFMGGEPLLSFNKILKIVDIVRELSNDKILKFEVVTNGYFLDDYIINKLKENKMFTVQITLDGDRTQHNATRKHLGKYDSYDFLIKKIEKAIKFMEVIIRVNFSNEIEFNSIKNMLEELKKIGVKLLYFSHIEHNSCTNRNLYNMSIIENYKKLWRLQLDAGFVLFQSLPSVITNCVAKNINAYTINYDGQLYMCPISCGNEKYLEGSINNTVLKKYVSYNSIKKYEQLCRNCNLFPICFGGCPYSEFSQKSEVKLNCNKFFVTNIINEYIKIKYF